ncbi:MAG: DUF6146 family protein [Flavobacterium sp.]
MKLKIDKYQQSLYTATKFIAPIVLVLLLASCHFDKNITTKAKTPDKAKADDIVRIANDSLEYEVIIIDPGFSSWLATQARPRGFYSELFLESRNQLYVNEWNLRALQPQRYGGLYEMQINYDQNIHYGYEVNYLIYNYMTYFQIKNRQQLAGFVPRP